MKSFETTSIVRNARKKDRLEYISNFVVRRRVSERTLLTFHKNTICIRPKMTTDTRFGAAKERLAHDLRTKRHALDRGVRGCVDVAHELFVDLQKIEASGEEFAEILEPLREATLLGVARCVVVDDRDKAFNAALAKYNTMSEIQNPETVTSALDEVDFPDDGHLKTLTKTKRSKLEREPLFASTWLEKLSAYENLRGSSSSSKKGAKRARRSDAGLEVLGGVETSIPKCPISQKELSDPVKNPVCGHVFERSAVLGVLKTFFEQPARRQDKKKKWGALRTGASSGLTRSLWWTTVKCVI